MVRVMGGEWRGEGGTSESCELGDRGSGRGDEKDGEIVVWCAVLVSEGLHCCT